MHLEVRSCVSNMADSLQSPFLAAEDIDQQKQNVRSSDLPPIESFLQFARESLIESKKLWSLSGPAILTTVCQYAIGSVTQMFAGHLSSLELAAVSIGISVIIVFSFGFMVSTVIPIYFCSCFQIVKYGR